MKKLLIAGTVVLLALSALSARALMRDNGEVMASSSLSHEEGEISLEYRSLWFGQKTLNDVFASDKEREFINRGLKRKIRGKLKVDGPILIGGELRLKAGEHPFHFKINGADDFALIIGEEGHVVELTTDEAPWLFPNLACAVVADGDEAARLAFFYGEYACGVSFKFVAEEDESTKDEN